MRQCFLAAAFLFACCFTLVAQQSPEEIREFYRETVREKIRFDLNQLDRIPTVGEIRAQHALEASDPKGFSLAGIDAVVSDNSAPESEVHAAVNPVDSANIVVSPIRQGQGQLTCPIYYTRDFGQSWERSSFVNLPPQSNAQVVGGGDPVFAFDAEGHLYFTWINLYTNGTQDSTFAAIFWADSEDGGETWEFDASRTVVIDAVAEGLPLGIFQLPRFSDKQWMAVDRTDGPRRNQLYIAYVELELLRGTGQIAVRRMLPGADGVIDISVPVSNGTFGVVQFSSIDVDYAGNVHVTFFGQRQGVGWGLWHSVSTNGGESFSDPQQVSPVRFGQQRFGGRNSESISGISDDRLYPSPYIAIDGSEGPHRGNVYAVWTALGVDRDEGNGFDIYCSRLVDFNNAEIEPAWSEPIVINDDGVDSDQFYPSVTVSPEGVVIVTWYDKRGAEISDEAHYYMAYSFDGGKTFTDNIQVTSEATDFATIGRQNGGFGIGEYTQVIATSGYAIPVWADGRNGNGDMDVYAGFFPITQTPSSAPDHVAAVETGLTVRSVLPNPVRGEYAVLDFVLDQPLILNIDVVDIEGKSLSTIVSGERFESGEHQVRVHTGGLLSGTYFCRLKTERGFAVRKIVVE